MSYVAIAVGASAVIGGAASMIGAKKNADAIDRSNAANAEQAKQANMWNYQMWLEKNGVAADGTPINTVLPRWSGITTLADGTKKAAVLNQAQMGGSSQDVLHSITGEKAPSWTDPTQASKFLTGGK